MRRWIYIVLVLLVLLVLSPKPVSALACSGTCRKLDCAAGEVEDTTRTCTLYDYICCKKVPTNPPASTNPPKPTKPLANPNLSATPYPTTIKGNPTPSPYWDKCTDGWCGNGYYCCQNNDGSPACCPVGEVPPTGSGGNGGSAPTNTPTPSPTPTPISAFVKLKNTSFYNNRALSNPIPANPVAYDSDDDGTANFIIASLASDPGLLSATSITLGSGAPSTKGWMTTSSSNNTLFTPSSFATYVKSRTNFKTITSLSDITSQNYNQQILLFDGDLTLDDPTTFSNRSLVLIVDGNATISYSGAFTPTNSSLAILATGGLTFSPTVTSAKGIFIAQSIDTGTTSNQGLKITGNLIALDSFTNNRRWSNTSIPTVFIVFDKDQYLYLLPMLSTVNYQWSESN